MLPEKVISAGWMKELPVEKDKTSCLSFSILLPVHWLLSISRPPPCFHLIEKSLSTLQSGHFSVNVLVISPSKGWKKPWGLSTIARAHPLGEWTSAKFHDYKCILPPPQCQSLRWDLLEVVILYKLLEFLYVANWQQILLDMWQGHQVIWKKKGWKKST